MYGCVRTVVATGALALAMASTPAAALADGAGKAKTLIKQADHALDEAGCFRADRSRTGCGDVEIFKGAAAKYEAAVKADPNPATALAACYLHKKSQGPDLEWSKSSGAFMLALARCDFAAFHPSTDPETRKRALRVGGDMRTELRFSRSQDENDKRIAAAAKALYGVGLKMKYDKKAKTISLAYGDLDEATLQGYIGEYYAGYAPKVMQRTSRRGPSVSFLDEDKKAEYLTLLEGGTMGWVLLEPMAKNNICQHMVEHMRNGTNDVAHWCQMQSLIEANAPIFAFSGKAVDWKVTDNAGGGLSATDRIFLPTIDGHYSPVITIGGPERIDDYLHITIQRKLAYQFKRGNKYRNEALALMAPIEKVAAAKEKKWAQADAKLGGKGAKVVWSETTFEGWDIPPLLGKNANGDCAKLYYRIYAPKKADGSYDAEFKIDGKTCNVVGGISSVKNSRAVSNKLMASTAVNDGCPDALTVPGDHAIAITIYPNKASKTGNKVLTHNSVNWQVKDEYMGYWGKKVGTFKAKCTTAGKGATSRFE